MTTTANPASRPSTAQEQAPAPGQDPAALLEQILESQAFSGRVKIVSDALTAKIDRLRALLPDYLKSQAERFIRRACLYFSQRPELEACTPQSFMICVLQAAELGLCIDGKLAYAVPYKDVAVMQADYKGILAVARRNKLIRDCFARLVHENDEFRFWEEDDKTHLLHTPAMSDPGPVVGVYAKVLLADGWKFEYMPWSEIETIRNRASKAYQHKKGPWMTDPGEMAKKTVIRRCLKTYCDDPSIHMLLSADDGDYPEADLKTPTSSAAERVEAKLANGHAKRETTPPARPTKPARPEPDQAPPDEDDVTDALASEIEKAADAQALAKLRKRVASLKDELGDAAINALLNRCWEKRRELVGAPAGGPGARTAAAGAAEARGTAGGAPTKTAGRKGEREPGEEG